MARALARPILTVDVVLLTLRDTRLHVALQPRTKHPFAGRLALIGGYVHPDDDISTLAAAERVLRVKAGVTARLLEQLMTFSGADRDPRGWSASVAYYALVAPEELAASGRHDLQLLPLDHARPLPFDHDIILARAIDRWRRRAAYSSLPAFLLPECFTLPDLRMVYETVLGRSLNDSAFRRKVDELRLVERVPGATSRATARPAQLYRLRNGRLTEFDRTV